MMAPTTRRGMAAALEAVAAAEGCTVSELCGLKRADVIRLRWEIMEVLRQRTDLTLEEIGSLLGRFHHTTISHGLKEMARHPGTRQSVLTAFGAYLRPVPHCPSCTCGRDVRISRAEYDELRRMAGKG